MEEFVKTLLLTGKMAVITTAVLFVFSLPIAYWLAYSKFKGKVIFDAHQSYTRVWKVFKRNL